jgi:DNA-binding phage protein
MKRKTSGERSPDFDTILKVMGALGLRLHAEAAHRSQRAKRACLAKVG